MNGHVTVEDLRRLRAAARGNPAADAAYVDAWNRAPQAVKEALIRTEGTR